MKIKHIDHIGVAVREIAQAGKFYTDILGLKIEGIENVADQKANVAFIPITDSEVELVESTHEDGPVARHIESRGEGIQHIALPIAKGSHRQSITILYRVCLQPNGLLRVYNRSARCLAVET